MAKQCKGNPAKAVSAAPQAVFPSFPRPGPAGVKNVPSCLAKAASTGSPNPPIPNYQTNPPRPNQLKSNHLRQRQSGGIRQGSPASRVSTAFPPPWSGQRQKCPIVLGEGGIYIGSPEPPISQLPNKPTAPQPAQIKSLTLSGPRAAPEPRPPSPPAKSPKIRLPLGHFGTLAASKTGRPRGRKKKIPNKPSRPPDSYPVGSASVCSVRRSTYRRGERSTTDGTRRSESKLTAFRRFPREARVDRSFMAGLTLSHLAF